jgi:hypothetical protein
MPSDESSRFALLLIGALPQRRRRRPARRRRRGQPVARGPPRAPADPDRRAARRRPPPPPVSLSARKVYEQARSQLVQIRTVLKGQASQTSVGSGFVVTQDGLIVTNFHVVSEAALKPERHELSTSPPTGREAPLQILQLDVLHDLALLRAADSRGKTFDALAVPTRGPAAGAGRAHLLARQPARRRLRGRPGHVQRDGQAQLLSADLLRRRALGRHERRARARRGRATSSASTSPAASTASRSASSCRRPSRARCWRAAATRRRSRARLPDRRRAAAEAPGAADRALPAQGWKSATHPRYLVPVPPDVFMRCWGSSEPSRTGGMDFERSDCVMDTRIFVGEFNTGTISLRHESYDGSKLGALRFASRYSQSFRNESFTRLSAQHQTKPRCNEEFVDRDGLPLRAVVCMRAYKKLPQLYDVSVLVATLDQAESGVQGRFDAQGVSFGNAQKLRQHYLDAFKWVR